MLSKREELLYGCSKEEFDFGVLDNDIKNAFLKSCKCINDVSGKVDYSVDYNSLLEYFSNISIYKFDVETWRKLYFVASENALFRLSLVLRNKYKEVLRGDSNITPWRRVQCAIEEDDVEVAKKIISNIEKLDDYKRNCYKDITSAKMYLDKIYGKETHCLRAKNSVFPSKIHLYGPLEYRQKKANPLETVARIDDRIDRNNRDRTNFLYINSESYEELKDSEPQFWERFDCVSIKEADSLIDNKTIFRHIPSINSLFLFGYPNMVPLIVFDLINEGVEEIIVSGVNLYCSRNAYDKGYEGYAIMKDNKKRKKRLASWCIHDVLSQFYFLKNIYRNKKIIVDEEMERIMQMSDYEYAQNMEKEHMIELIDRRI